MHSSDIEPADRLIFALDFPDQETALGAVKGLGDSVNFYKVGWELFMSGDAFSLGARLQNDHGKKVMLDLKFFDVPETVGRTVKKLPPWATFATVQGYKSIVKGAVENNDGDTKLLAVTVLTSLDQGDMAADGFQADLSELVLSRTQVSLAAGADGVILSAHEVKMLRDALKDPFIVVSPGIRLGPDPVPGDDQKRTATPLQAFARGSDYVVVGRPIKNAPDPRAAAEQIQQTIHDFFR